MTSSLSAALDNILKNGAFEDIKHTRLNLEEFVGTMEKFADPHDPQQPMYPPMDIQEGLASGNDNYMVWALLAGMANALLANQEPGTDLSVPALREWIGRYTDHIENPDPEDISILQSRASDSFSKYLYAHRQISASATECVLGPHSHRAKHPDLPPAEWYAQYMADLKAGYLRLQEEAATRSL